MNRILGKVFMLAVTAAAVTFLAPRAAECSYAPGFIRAADVIPDIVTDIRYAGENNFAGVRIDGYAAPEAILTVEAAAALKRAADSLRAQGYRLKIFDAYRPVKAVEHFVRWGKDPKDAKNKMEYYPNIEKSALFRGGYISGKSTHSNGSTVDLTIVDSSTGEEVDMGSPFDYFGEISHVGTKLITQQQSKNRLILKEAMVKSGFSAIKTEWWHFKLQNEPYPNKKFNFPVDSPEAADEKTSAALDRISNSRVITAVPGRTKGRAVIRAYAKSGNVWTLRFTVDGYFGKNGVNSIYYNTDPIEPGKGSAIFLHRSDGSPTVGSISVSEAAMVFFLGFIDEETKILISGKGGF